MITVFAVISFISSHPGVVAAIVGVLVTLIGALIGGYWGFIGQELRKLKDADIQLRDRVGDVELTLRGYEEHVGAGDKMLSELRGGFTHLDTRLAQMHTDNITAHSAIVERLAKVETRMPNGELTTLVNMVQALINRKP